MIYGRSDVVVAPNPLDLLSLAFVRDQHLRVPNNGGVDDEFITRLIRSAYTTGERETRRSLVPQTRQLVLSAFPFDACVWNGDPTYHLPGIVSRRWIVFPEPPLIEVTKIEYIDTDGNTVEMNASPLEYRVSIPKGPRCGRGYAVPDPISRGWPQTSRDVMEAVFITYRAGYEETSGSPFGSPAGSPSPELPEAGAAVPADIVSGILLLIGEMYKQRSESIVGTSVVPAVTRAHDLFMGYRAY